MPPFLSRPLFLPPPSSVTRLAIVGDVHDLWSRHDVVALKALHPDLTLFVGDIGNEAVELVRSIAALDVPKAVVLGNHDAHFTLTPKKRATLKQSTKRDSVNAQLDALGDDHIGFAARNVTDKAVSVVGARPFSGGGTNRRPRIVENIYGYRGVEECAQAIANAALGVPPENTMVIMGHNGPTGLGSERHDICGVDFRSEAGDHGDEDLRLCLTMLRQHDRNPALVAFGHMHHRLSTRHGQAEAFRRRLVFNQDTQTLFLNAAVVPRVFSHSPSNDDTLAGIQRHHFCVVEIEEGVVVKAEDAYVKMKNGCLAGDVEIVPLFERRYAGSESAVRVLNTHSGTWETVPPEPNGVQSATKEVVRSL